MLQTYPSSQYTNKKVYKQQLKILSLQNYHIHVYQNGGIQHD